MASAVDGVEQLETYYGKYLPQLLVTVLAPVGTLRAAAGHIDLGSLLIIFLFR